MRVVWRFKENAWCKVGLAFVLLLIILFYFVFPAWASGNDSLSETSQRGGITGSYPSGENKNTIHVQVVGSKTPPQKGPTSDSEAVPGYTEAQIREQMQKKYGEKTAVFRRVSGAAADTGYTSGTLDVKIPTYFFPADIIKTFTETYQIKSDGMLSEITTKSKKTANVNEKSQKATGSSDVPRQPMLAESPAPAKERGKYKDITIQIPVHAASPFRLPHASDFFWFCNDKGKYKLPLVRTFSQDPLKGLPAQGPMLIRHGAVNEILAVTVDDPSDIYYYKNTDTLPAFGKAVPVYTETRRTADGKEANIRYIRYFRGGIYCLVVRGDIKDGERTFCIAAVFPESKQYEYLPQVLYVIENIKGQK